MKNVLKNLCASIPFICALNTATFAADNSDCKESKFDLTVWGDQLQNEKNYVGFGGITLLELIDDPKTRPTYLKMRSLGSLKIAAQKLAARNSDESKITRLTFEAWKRTDFDSSYLAATWTVDCYEDLSIADGGPTEYIVGNIVMHPKNPSE